MPNSPHVRGRLTEQGDFVKLKPFKEAFATHRKYTKVRRSQIREGISTDSRDAPCFELCRWSRRTRAPRRLARPKRWTTSLRRSTPPTRSATLPPSTASPRRWSTCSWKSSSRSTQSCESSGAAPSRCVCCFPFSPAIVFTLCRDVLARLSMRADCLVPYLSSRNRASRAYAPSFAGCVMTTTSHHLYRAMNASGVTSISERTRACAPRDIIHVPHLSSSCSSSSLASPVFSLPALP